MVPNGVATHQDDPTRMSPSHKSVATNTDGTDPIMIVMPVPVDLY
jgi:hypothetical protein